MAAILNLGNPSKDFTPVAEAALGVFEARALKITGARLFRTASIILTSGLYGAGMTLDCLEEMARSGLLRPRDKLILVGSMGSLVNDIELGDVVIPNPCVCAYYGYDGLEVVQDLALLGNLKRALLPGMPPEYRHGSSFAVFDPHTDHEKYVSSLYGTRVQGVDCGEVYIGLEFARRMDVEAAAVLYASDTPSQHINDIGDVEFAKLAYRNDVTLNSVAASVLRQ
jgi:hypothetical protein